MSKNERIERNADEIERLRDDLRELRDAVRKLSLELQHNAERAGKLAGKVTPAVIKASEPVPPTAVVPIPCGLASDVLGLIHGLVVQIDDDLDTEDAKTIQQFKQLVHPGTCPTCEMPYHPSFHTEDEPCPKA